MCHKQPVLEKNIRNVIYQNPSGEIRSGSTVQAISEDEDWVYVTYTDKEGQTKKLRSKFFVGADGKTGFTRKRYLEPKGITMEKDKK
jgi:2-polyprenyl-6-methoxyphenol hydroxylase-like FAD-dependent oxidoreductase